VSYAKRFFDLQLTFARAVSVLSARPLADVLLEYTNLYIRFGLGRDFDPAHPGWRRYVEGLQPESDDLDWTYRFYLTCPPASPGAAGDSRISPRCSRRSGDWSRSRRVSSAHRGCTTSMRIAVCSRRPTWRVHA
jgi:hypothetical protein